MQDYPSLTGWSTVTGSGPAPTLAWNDASYTLNGGAGFKLTANAAALQTNQRALGGDYAQAVVKRL